MTTMTTTAENGVPFCVRILRKGDAYGPTPGLNWDSEEPGVEFYDKRHPFTEYGQFVARYYLSSIADATNGLNLYGGIADWQIDAQTMTGILGWLKALTQDEATAAAVAGNQYALEQAALLAAATPGDGQRGVLIGCSDCDGCSGVVRPEVAYLLGNMVTMSAARTLLAVPEDLYCQCCGEELMVVDSQGFYDDLVLLSPYGERLSFALRLDEWLTEVEEWLPEDAVRAAIKCALDTTGDLTSITAEALFGKYAGTARNRAEWAYEYVESNYDVPEYVSCHVDWAALADDILGDFEYTYEDGAGFHVFRY